jgi:hypothetical protein
MARMLRQTETGREYIWAPIIAERPDMEEFESDNKPAEKIKQAVVAKEEVIEEPEEETTDEARVEQAEEIKIAMEIK